MKKHLKRLTAMIICLSLTLSVGVLPVRAQTDDLSVRLFCTDNAALQCSVLVLGWYGFYLVHAAVGEIPDVTLEYTEADGTARTIAVEKDKILQEVYAVESDPAARKCVPQLTVCLPMYAVYLPQDTRGSLHPAERDDRGAGERKSDRRRKADEPACNCTRMV